MHWTILKKEKTAILNLLLELCKGVFIQSQSDICKKSNKVLYEIVYFDFSKKCLAISRECLKAIFVKKCYRKLKAWSRQNFIHDVTFSFDENGG